MIVDIRDPLSIEALQVVVAARKGQRFGLTSGVFDLTHHLHLNYLERCAGFCDFLVVGVDSDDVVKKDKGPARPFYNEIQRMAMIGAFRCVHIVFVIRDLENDFTTMAKILKPIIFKNRDFSGHIVGSEHARSIMIVHDVNNIGSTTMAVETIVAAAMQTPPGEKAK